MAKGIELPVNVLVIIVIAVLVLIALATLVATGILSMKPIQVMLERNTACATYACGAVSAANININVDLDGKADTRETLVDLCKYDQRCTTGTVAEISKYCSCPI